MNSVRVWTSCACAAGVDQYESWHLENDCSSGQYEASFEIASIRTYMYGLVVAGAYLADLSVGMTDDRAHRLLLLWMVDDFATKDG